MTLAEIQALWAVAHMNGKLSKKTEEEMEEDVALVIAWRRRRYLGDGHTFLFDGHEVRPFPIRNECFKLVLTSSSTTVNFCEILA